MLIRYKKITWVRVKQMSCTICHVDVGTNVFGLDTATCPSCKQSFHPTWIYKWGKACPNCRADVWEDFQQTFETVYLSQELPTAVMYVKQRNAQTDLDLYRDLASDIERSIA